jgi:hypothetical protein
MEIQNTKGNLPSPPVGGFGGQVIKRETVRQLADERIS